MNSDKFDIIVRQRVLDNRDVALALVGDARFAVFVAEVARAVLNAYREGRKLLLFGNGGSAADSQHIAAEFVGHYLLDRPSLPAIALADSSAATTAISNDYGYHDVFARQVKGLAVTGDVAIGLSTSGRSVNVLQGLRVARSSGLVTVAMTGQAPSQMAESADYFLQVPSSDTARIQETHMLVGHTVAELVEAALFGEPAT